MNFEIGLELPKGSFTIRHRGVEYQEENTITYHGLDLFSSPSSRDNPIVNPSGGVFKYAKISNGVDGITFNSVELGGEYLISTPIDKARVDFSSVDGGRYADIHIHFVFKEVDYDINISQVGLFSSDDDATLMFGKQLESPIYVNRGEDLEITYSIRTQIISSYTKIGEGIVNNTPFEVEMLLHSEESNTIHLNYPKVTGGSSQNQAYSISRPLFDGQQLSEAFDCETVSSKKLEGMVSTFNFFYKIGSMRGNRLDFRRIDCAEGENRNHAIRIIFGERVRKDLDEIFEFSFTLKISWGKYSVQL